MEQHLLDGSANPEWLNMKAGKFSGSDFHQYLGILKTGKLSETAKKELSKKILENFGYRFDTFQTPAMARGIELEPTAREAYSFIYGRDIQEVGFVDLEKYHAGCSPDGVIYGFDMVETEPRTITMINKKTGKTTDIIDDIAYKKRITEIVEIKCPMIETFVSYLDPDFMNPDYATQCQFNMFITGADVCHFVVYHPDFNLIVRDIPKDEEMQNKIQTALEKLQGMYDEMYERISKQKLETVGE
jgi:hypothetical protein